jgi:ankyrin repeat protein
LHSVYFRRDRKKSANVNSTVNFGSSIPKSGNSSSMVVSQEVCSGILDQFTKEANGKDISECLSQSIEALMPENVFSNSLNMQMAVPQDHQSPELNFLNLTMFLVSNNFFGATADVSNKIYEWIKRRSNAALLEYLLSINGPTSEALAENIFRLAIDAKDVVTVKKILKSGFDFSEQVYHTLDGQKLTLLQRACEVTSVGLVRVLLEAGADVNSTVCPHRSALGCAIRYLGDESDLEDDLLYTELVRTLLHAGAKLNTGDGVYALSEAAASRHVELVALLLAAGADVNFTEINGHSPLTEVVMRYKHDHHDERVIVIVRKLLQAGADFQAVVVFQDQPFTVLHLAIENGKTEVIQLLLDSGAIITEPAFHAAFDCCNEDTVKLLVKYGARVTQRVIEGAVEGANTELVLFLLKCVENGMKEALSATALTWAIHHGEMDIIERLDSFDVRLTSTDDLETAMAEAAGRGDIRVFQLLLDDQSRHRASAIQSLDHSLGAAIANSQKDVTELLLAVGANVNTESHLFDKSPLLAAIHQKDAHLARKLLDAGAELNGECYSETHDTWVPVWDIISAGADVNRVQNYGGKTALTVAVEKRDVLTIQTLIEAGSDVNAYANIYSGHTPLEAAVLNKDNDMVDYILGIGAHTDEASLIAAVFTSVELMQMILLARSRQYRRHPMGSGCAALQAAVVWKKAAIVEILLENGVDTNTIVRRTPYNMTRFDWNNQGPEKCLLYGESALQTAIRTDEGNDLSIVRMLLRGGANPNGIVKESPNITALLAGIDRDNMPLVKALIEAGADVNAGLTAGVSRTPLQLAVEKGRMELVHTILEHGADVNAPPFHRHGATALQFAAIKGYVGIAHLLLERGAEVNAGPANVEGRTALEGAAEHGRIDMLQLLLSAGALIIGPGSEQYERAWNFASENGHIAARRLLESYHAWLLEGFAGWDPMATDVGGSDDLLF